MMRFIAYDIALLILLVYGIRRGWFFSGFDPRYKQIESRVKAELSWRVRILRVLFMYVIYWPLWLTMLWVPVQITELWAEDLDHWWPPLIGGLVVAGVIMYSIMISMVSWHLSNRLFLRS
jgi:hypothetical protein